MGNAGSPASNANVNVSFLLGHLFRLAFATAVAYGTAKLLLHALDPTRKQRDDAEKRAKEIMRRLKLPADMQLSEHELQIATQLVVPEEIDSSWSDVAGLDSLIQELRETLILPIKQRHLFAKSRLVAPPKGVLLYGPPGVGKTLLAKATAKEAGTRFINLQVSMLTDKWYGESQKLAASVFSLAKKIQPCIIFIDEIDCFLRSRDGTDHEATAMMKAQFLSLWDGLGSREQDDLVIVIGATNRPQAVDHAILRRMPAQLKVPLPDLKQRRQILQLILREELHSVDLEQLSQATDGASGSDLREICRGAAITRVTEAMAELEQQPHLAQPPNQLYPDVTRLTAGGGGSGVAPPLLEGGTERLIALRPITMTDFNAALAKWNQSRAATGKTFQSLFLGPD
ncbi:unnamed protein product [Cyprideis torosa]|uniref:Uncharacterized protein n=1 Tax=Cyprideis torosa TaxID=163714 RepID=A0A7R8WDZ4_9CRUS|nr:unnamed protein product [Cyprideis torosa]CAG0895233.1 unnamed protein product [Cyprideis torosa]